MNTKYPNLLSPVRMNRLILKNRICAAPCGRVGIKAKGGASYVIVGNVSVKCEKSDMNPTAPYQLDAPQKHALVEKVSVAHFYGARVGAELLHVGMFSRVQRDDYSYGPCDTTVNGHVVKALNEEQMKQIAAAYAQTALDCRELGFDIAFLHFAHGWLPTQFLTPYFNKRTDEYGGSIENRARFPLMILKAVREAVGPNYPIDMRISALDRLDAEETMKLEDTIKFCQMAEEYVDCIHVSCGLDTVDAGGPHMMSSNLCPQMYNADLAHEIKKNLKKALVCVVGAIDTAEDAEMIISQGKADLVAIGRGIIADPDLPKKIMEGRPEDIVPCLRCNNCFWPMTYFGHRGCSVNPTIYYRNTPTEIEKATEPKTIVVVGAGPAGIKAALTAGEAGHNVILLEKEKEVGGLLKFISKEHHKIEVQRYLSYLKTQLEKSNVRVITGVNADRSYVESLNPDKIIVAIGAQPAKPPIPGIESQNVMDCLQVIDHPEQVKERVAVIGAGTVGCELAIEFAEEGKQVYLIEMADEIGMNANKWYKVALKQNIDKLENIKVSVSTRCTKIDKDGLHVANKEETILDVETVVLATGMSSKTEEAYKFYGITPFTESIGDVVNPRNIMEATIEGFGTGSCL